LAAHGDSQDLRDIARHVIASEIRDTAMNMADQPPPAHV
jgi:hypothetical protein